MLDELTKLGPGAAGIVATAASMSDAELTKLIGLYGRSGKSAGDTFAKNLDEAGPVLREIARTRGSEVADQVRRGMDSGRQSVFDAARAMGIDIDNGIGRDREVHITIYEQYIVNKKTEEARNSADGNIFMADGGLHFANGSERHVAQISGFRGARVWAEPETGGEAYIPLSGMKRGRSESILSEVADRFGGMYLRPMGSMSAATSAAAGGSSGPNVTYNITVDASLSNPADVGAKVVYTIQEYERRSGAAWRRTT